MDSNQFREAAHSAIEEIIQYYDTLDSRRVLSSVSPGYLRPLLPSGPPQEGEAWDKIQADVDKVIMPGLTHWQSPNFMAFFPASSTYPGMLGELYSAAFTAPAFNWLCSPAVTELETVVLDWLAVLLGLPKVYLSEGQGGGVIQGSASEAIATVAVAARERLLSRRTEGIANEEEREDAIGNLRGKLIALGSDQAHSSTQKAANIAGTRFKSVKTSAETKYAVTGKQLRQTLEEVSAKGLIPYYITVSLGTTSTCAVDNFEEIAEVLQDYPDLWVHVDAAYAGAALILPEYQHLTKAFDKFDSFNMNMHKWLLTNFDASCLFVRKRSDLTSALSITPSYLKNDFSDSGLVTDYRDWQIPLGRRFRALKIWFVMRSYGIKGMQEHIKHTISLGETFHELVKGRPDLFSVLTGPAFGLTVITVTAKSHYRRLEARKRQAAGSTTGTGTLTPANAPSPYHEAYLNDFSPDAEQHLLQDANNTTKAVYERVNSEGKVYLTGSLIAGVYAIRVVSANPKAEEKYVRRAFEVLVEVAESILKE